MNTKHSRPARWRRVAGACLAVALGASLAACAPAGDGRVKLDFFQFKPEAVAEFKALVDEFEARNPDIDVVINSVPDPDTAIRTLLVKGKTPDVLTLNGNGNFADLASSCVFADLSAFPSASRVKPEVQQILNALGTCHGSETNGLPFANNASAILYNPEIFAKYNVKVPRTWDELIAAAETFKANGVAPFYMTLKDAWTVMPAYVNLAGNLKPEGFFEDIRAAKWTPQTGTHGFAKDGKEAAEKLKQALQLPPTRRRQRRLQRRECGLCRGQIGHVPAGQFRDSRDPGRQPRGKDRILPVPDHQQPGRDNAGHGRRRHSCDGPGDKASEGSGGVHRVPDARARR